jgi:hypothetical protein
MYSHTPFLILLLLLLLLLALYRLPGCDIVSTKCQRTTTHQDDFAVIATKLPRLPQQHGSSIGTATPLAPSTDSTLSTSHIPTAAAAASSNTVTVSSSGILSTAGQMDFFAFEAGAGPASIAVAVTAPFGVGAFTQANLKAAAVVYDASGVVLDTLMPPKGFAMAVPESTAQLPTAGTYYVAVSGIGADTPATGGYSNYGSLGWYALTVTALNPAVLQSVNDCAGSWSVWGACSESCKQTSTYSITRPAAAGGAACPYANGVTRSRSCSSGTCSRAVGRRDCIGSWCP